MTCKIVLAAILVATTVVSAQTPSTVFKGRPSVKISEGGVGRLPEAVSRENAVNIECVISQIGENYYWASRENKPLVRIESTGFVTFVAVDGAGYVRILRPEQKTALSVVDEAAEKFDYVEHLLLGLRSVTYYGERR
jgi:hypothetical protein